MTTEQAGKTAKEVTTTYLTTEELAERIKYDARTIRTRLKDAVLLEGIHYIRPFGGRKLLFKWEQIQADMALLTEGVRNGRSQNVAQVGTEPARTERPADKWSPLEDQYLRESWGVKHISELTLDLGRSQRSIYDRAQKIGLERPSAWTDTELSVLADHYADEGPKGVAMRLGRTEKAVQLQARRQGLLMRARHNAWTAKEDALLRQVVGTMALREIYETFFKMEVDDGVGKEFSRSYAAIAQRCGALGITLSRSEASRSGRARLAGACAGDETGEKE